MQFSFIIFWSPTTFLSHAKTPVLYSATASYCIFPPSQKLGSTSDPDSFTKKLFWKKDESEVALVGFPHFLPYSKISECQLSCNWARQRSSHFPYSILAVKNHWNFQNVTFSSSISYFSKFTLRPFTVHHKQHAWERTHRSGKGPIPAPTCFDNLNLSSSAYFPTSHGNRHVLLLRRAK